MLVKYFKKAGGNTKLFISLGNSSFIFEEYSSERKNLNNFLVMRTWSYTFLADPGGLSSRDGKVKYWINLKLWIKV